METSRTVEHDVFIDFSSKDTRHSFVSHLHAAFRRQGISVFLAEHCALSEATLKPGFELANEIQLAIERSKVYVVVFSKNYASSPLCLETLMTFMDLQRRKDGPVVIPVFYGEVTRSIVEQQTERFKEDFSKHHGFFSDEKDRVERWRKGLTEAAKLLCHESIEQQNDSELVEDIVADVREKLYPTGMIGFYSRLLGIENLLFKQSHDIYRLGIWGMPGIGKTAIAQESFNQMTKHFETQCFIHEFHVDSVYEIPALNKKEAQRLFTRFAFSEKEPSDSNLIEVSKKVVEYANGNPLALYCGALTKASWNDSSSVELMASENIQSKLPFLGEAHSSFPDNFINCFNFNFEQKPIIHPQVDSKYIRLSGEEVLGTEHSEESGDSNVEIERSKKRIRITEEEHQ
ncbi:unnamed protein product [Arabidopsis arenosa]|uniref:TIR domain-containing protein n=1 Tax=Arabidopsis arenosa TaxID=38785 RepID=A0A8S2B7I6_ARAAE|nr:unnamed protein product [Arabidopsis arenosa]